MLLLYSFSLSNLCCEHRQEHSLREKNKVVAGNKKISSKHVSAGVKILFKNVLLAITFYFWGAYYYSELGVLLKRHLISWSKYENVNAFTTTNMSHFSKKSLEWRGSNLRCKPTIILYTLRDKVLNSIELRTKKTPPICLKIQMSSNKFFYFFVYKIDF